MGANNVAAGKPAAPRTVKVSSGPAIDERESDERERESVIGDLRAEIFLAE